jgi:hypothetical protein
VPGNPNQQVRVEAVSGTLMVVSGWLVKRGFLLLVRCPGQDSETACWDGVRGGPAIGGLLRSYNGSSSSATRPMTCRLYVL